MSPASTIDREPYQGTRRKLVLAFDVGTTYSGISYSILDPGQVPQIKPVTKFPAQENISGASKIPSVMYYDRSGKVRAVGAEAVDESIFEIAEEEEWFKTEWFKLHLRSRFTEGDNVRAAIPPFPPNKTITNVFSDFLKYLLTCAEKYITETHANGPQLWDSLKNDIDYVLSHPNGWEGTQQAEMRKAALVAGLVPDTKEGNGRLRFVTEGEASLHFAIHNGLPVGALTGGEGVVVVDAGGGTVDISAYRKRGKAFEELAVPQCHFYGSLFVSVHARSYLQNALSGSKYEDDIEDIIRTFDKTTKPRFRTDTQPQVIKFAGSKVNDPAYNIKLGQLKLPGEDVAQFFQPSIDCIVQAVKTQRTTAHHPISHVVLVGGFAASDWLFTKLQEILTPIGLTVSRPENHVNKAVSDGAISFYLDHAVRTRVSKVAYGAFISVPFEPDNPEHQARAENVLIASSGRTLIRGTFDVILEKNVQISETKEIREAYYKQYSHRNNRNREQFSLWCYRGTRIPPPYWRDQDEDQFTKLCTIELDLSTLPMTQHENDAGDTYYQLDYERVLLFGLTELKVFIAWKENGVEKRSETKIVYDPDTTSVSNLKPANVVIPSNQTVGRRRG